VEGFGENQGGLGKEKGGGEDRLSEDRFDERERKQESGRTQRETIEI